MQATTAHRGANLFFIDDMGLILLEALLALAVLIFIVWWTMFSGRRGGERREDRDDGMPPR